MERTRRALDVIPEQEMFARLPFYAKQSDELAVAMRAGEPGAFDRFCEFHLRLARKRSRILFHWFGMDEDDAFQIACIGIIYAAKKFDPTRGYQFSTIASYWIRNCCQRFGLGSAYLIRFPVHVFWPLYKMQFTERQLLASFGLPEARERLYQSCEHNNVSVNDWITYQRIKDLKTYSDLGSVEWDSLVSIKEMQKSPLDELILQERRQTVLAGIVRLSEREQAILRYRYGIDCLEHTLEEVAAIYGVTRERIRQIQARAEEKLKVFLSQLDPNQDSLIDADLPEDCKDELEETNVADEIHAISDPGVILQTECVEPPSDTISLPYESL